ncbi:MAG: DUF58 domain-containing protein [Desulfobacterota bacterium]|nr:DUF58 domain-containing protein [Thermodesulfobacteriota bacterium]
MTKTEKILLDKKRLLDIFIRHRIHSPFPGDWESNFKGLGYEFWSLRELIPGDPLCNIDWKATAKTGRYYIREYLAESYFNVMILYDISASVGFGRKELLQAQVAVSIAYSAIIANNGCGLILFADDIKGYLPPRMGNSHFREILNTIVKIKPYSCRTTKLQNALTKLVTEIPESLTFILSDFLYPLEFTYSFHRTVHGTTGHEVKAVQVLDAGEISLSDDSRGIIPLYDYESGETILFDLSQWENYNQKIAEAQKKIKQRLERAGIDLVTITPEDNFQQKINGFMKRPAFLDKMAG